MPKQAGQDAETVADRKKPEQKPLILPLPSMMPNPFSGPSTIKPTVTPSQYSTPYTTKQLFNTSQYSPLLDMSQNQQQPFIPMPGGASYYQKPFSGYSKALTYADIASALSPEQLAQWNALARMYGFEEIDPLDYKWRPGQMNTGGTPGLFDIPDNNQFVYPEQTNAPRTGGDASRDSGDNRNYDYAPQEQIPLPDPEYGGWGGGGYGQGYRDSGLINWRI